METRDFWVGLDEKIRRIGLGQEILVAGCSPLDQLIGILTTAKTSWLSREFTFHYSREEKWNVKQIKMPVKKVNKKI